MTSLGPQGNGTIWSEQLQPFISSLTKPAHLNIKYTKSCLACLDSSSWHLSVCIFSVWGLLIENELLTLVI